MLLKVNTLSDMQIKETVYEEIRLGTGGNYKWDRTFTFSVLEQDTTFTFTFYILSSDSKWHLSYRGANSQQPGKQLWQILVSMFPSSIKLNGEAEAYLGHTHV